MLYDSESGDFTMALLGDVMPTRRLAVFREERYLKIREILSSADATFANWRPASINTDLGTFSPKAPNEK